MIEAFIKIGFLEIRIWDILDILLVGYLIYQVYRLLRGSLALNIFVGLLLIFLAWLLVRALDMKLLEGILGQFIGVGVIALLIVFQPEVRRFLLLLGKGGFVHRETFWRRLFTRSWGDESDPEILLKKVINAIQNLSKSNTGAILVFSETSKLQFFANTGVEMNASISTKLIESIFTKTSPLHDGAVIIAEDKIVAAGCVLPVSDNPDLPSRVGMRHRAAVGITEHSDAIAVVVSEETGSISYARNGRLNYDVPPADVQRLLSKAITEDE